MPHGTSVLGAQLLGVGEHQGKEKVLRSDLYSLRWHRCTGARAKSWSAAQQHRWVVEEEILNA